MTQRASPRSAAVWIAGLTALGSLACGVQAPSAPHGSQSGSAAPAVIGPSDAGRAHRTSGTEEQRPVFLGCVVHAGEIRKTSTRIKLPGGGLKPAEVSGTCAMDAECVQHPGHATPGDGAVAIACENKICTCTLEPLAPRAEPTKFRIDLDVPCSTEERAKVLLTERCMRGMKIVP